MLNHAFNRTVRGSLEFPSRAGARFTPYSMNSAIEYSFTSAQAAVGPLIRKVGNPHYLITSSGAAWLFRPDALSLTRSSAIVRPGRFTLAISLSKYKVLAKDPAELEA